MIVWLLNLPFRICNSFSLKGTSNSNNVLYPADGPFVIIMEQDGDVIKYIVKDVESDRLEETRR